MYFQRVSEAPHEKNSLQQGDSEQNQVNFVGFLVLYGKEPNRLIEG